MSDRLIGPSALFLTDHPPTGPTLWRCFTVCQRLQERGYQAHWAPLQDDRLGQVATRFEAIILPRISWKLHERPLALRWFSAVHRLGQTAIYECDDDLFTTAFLSRVRDTKWEEGKSAEQLEQERQDRIWTLQQCDGVTVTTQRLATICRQYTERPVIVVPNAIDLRWFTAVLRDTKRVIKGLTIGWAGGRRADYDVAEMADAWGRIAHRYKHVTFVVQGWQPPIIDEHVPADRLVRIPWMPLELYPGGLKQVDIGCCAVADVPFNRGKSNIKVLEYAAAGAAVVASPLLYAGTVDHGSSGFIAETADEWEDALSQLIESHARRKIMARRLLKTVQKRHSLDGELHRWPDAWRAIVNDHRARNGAQPSGIIEARNVPA